jgi:deoxyribonuclease IV
MVENTGFHCSVSAGYAYLFDTVKKYGLDTFQVFTKNQRQWKEKTIARPDAEFFRQGLAAHTMGPVLSHTSYLVNLCSSTEEIRLKSIAALAAEIRRCDALGISYAVLHPGASRELSEQEAIETIAAGLKEVTALTAGSKVRILLENTAGQGSSIGWRFEHLGAIIGIAGEDRLGVCFDTCHAFAAGYDMRTSGGTEAVLQEFDRCVGLGHLRAFHFNDSKGALGSHLDRHEHIGKGQLGIVPFRELLKSFPHLPKVLETSHEQELHIRDLELLRSLE